jgi:hypothetical protein
MEKSQRAQRGAFALGCVRADPWRISSDEFRILNEEGPPPVARWRRRVIDNGQWIIDNERRNKTRPAFNIGTLNVQGVQLERGEHLGCSRLQGSVEVFFDGVDVIVAEGEVMEVGGGIEIDDRVPGG